MTDASDSDADHIYDVLIVGAGPCGLATAARLRERHPSALFTDEEQSRYSWISKHGRRASIKNKRNGHVKGPSLHRGQNSSTPSILVLDESGAEWMTRWNTLFKTFDISHLRSPMFFHPDPSDRDALLGFVYREDRTSEMVEIAGCVGKEISKNKRKKRINSRHERSVNHQLIWQLRRGGSSILISSISVKPAVEIDERDRKDYFAPSTDCFRDFCESCRDRYGLQQHVIRQETVKSIDFDKFDVSPSDTRIFSIKTSSSEYFSRTVVMAIGGGKPCIPPPFPPQLPNGAHHAMKLPGGSLLNSTIQAKMRTGKPTSTLVIGGGLTSAQIADAAIRKGVSKVHLFMRGPWKVKPFDVDLAWMSKFRNHQRAAFWTADNFDERLTYVREARNGGSITPRFSKLLKGHVQSGRLSIHTHTTVKSQSYCPESRSWCIEADPSIPHLPRFDNVYFATGMQIDVENIEQLQPIRERYPVPSHEGFPALTEDLMWNDDVPLFFTGRLATLQLGPGAGNLEGARLGAERIAWAIENVLEPKDKALEDGTEDAGSHLMHHRYAAGLGSRFEGLSVAEDYDTDSA